MRYHLREHAWGLTDNFTVRDDAGNDVFDIHGKIFHMGDNLVVRDHYTGQELVHIKQKLISFRPSYDIYRNGEHWANVHEQFHLFGERFKVQGDNGMVFHINGNVWAWNFTVNDSAGNLLGQVGREFSLFHECYAVDVAPGVDASFMVALAVVLEMVKDHQEDH
ncbi:LURP-one-related/scramblase family protein [Dictyobacter formicarum]|uniref:Uncharacterized protein n=1 Tax=Dictyobacter formicarum TaxID=2778368 RepID=A0ABQ3VH73_9CHLR|nr:LURP-one-related family protein [Dictyobacter formicarum]GHO85026.1 hypothetical protein KSZ_30320 [Dictyobacter formicarum]